MQKLLEIRCSNWLAVYIMSFSKICKLTSLRTRFSLSKGQAQDLVCISCLFITTPKQAKQIISVAQGLKKIQKLIIAVPVNIHTPSTEGSLVWSPSSPSWNTLAFRISNFLGERMNIFWKTHFLKSCTPDQSGYGSSFMHQSIPAVPIRSPPGNCRAFAHAVSPCSGAFAVFLRPKGWAFVYPKATPGLFSKVPRRNS